MHLTDGKIVIPALTWTLLQLSICVCVNVHLMDPVRHGITIFNASLGKSWEYSVDAASTGARSLFTVDQTTGVIYTKKDIKCSKLNINHFTLVVFAKRIYSQRDIAFHNFANSSVTLPLTLIVHGRGCLSTVHRKTTRRKSPLHRSNSSIKVNINFLLKDWCLPCNKSILNRKDYIPSSLSKCKNSLHLFNTQTFALHKPSGSIRTTEQVCSSSNRWILHAKCVDSDDMVVNIIIEIDAKNIERNLMNFDTGIKNQSPLVRLKRQTGDNAPSFAQMNYYASVEEEQNPGKHVITITATDPDSGDAGRLTYSMTALTDQRSKDMFAINPVSGAVNTTQRLDREYMWEHFFSILAVDNAREPQTAQTILTITVQDINDKAPVFENNVSYKEISESVSVGFTVFTVKATDGDEGQNAEVRYFLVNSGPPNDVFLIDPTEGSITTRSKLDREKIASYQLLIRATDQGPSASRKSATATVNFRILDDNDNYPQFAKKTYHVNISEDYNFSQNPVILTVTATDADEGINQDITYAIFGGNTFDTFAINRKTGAISMQKSLDYEQTKQFQLSVRAQDGGQLTNSTTVIVDVLDVNDNDPEFYSSPHVGTVLENAAINSTVLNVQARDADSGKNQELVYSIVNPAPDLPFFVTNGELKVKSELDRESRSNYEFVVKAQDLGVPPRSATTQVQITVRDVNDNSPVFQQKFYNITVPEDTQVGARVISLTASDQDSGDNSFVTYSIMRGNENNVFKMTTVSGEGLISLIGDLNYKIQNVYILTVVASDPGSLNDTATVQINVLDTNQHKPSFQGTPYRTNVEENIDVGTSIYKVLAIDQDVGENARISYQILGNTDFEIDASSGTIKTRIELDRETKLSYNFEVTARDHGQPALTATEMVTIFVTDVNDNSPEFTQPVFVGSIVENARVTQSVLTVSATDRDKNQNALIHYEFVKSDNPHFGDFDIDPASGTVRVAKPLDRETVAKYNYTALAIDGGLPPRSSSVAVIINITDINDNQPIFDDMVVKVAENTPRNKAIAHISAVDPDEGVNAQIEYEMLPGLDSDSFDLDFKPGGPAILRNKIDLDYESLPNKYQVRIRAWSTPRFTDATVRILVQDINDNEPVLKDFTIIFNNYVDKFINGPVGRVPATDPDEIDRDRLRYEIVAGNDASFLHLNRTTGELTLDYRLNSDVPRNGTVEIKVSDGKNEKKATCRLYVRLVTKEMLQNSVTIRLNNMTQSTFLSPLFKFFQDALATILRTEEKNIYVISVKNDTEIKGAVLNVSVAVRRPEGGFLAAEDIREQIYLQRILLANLSTLQVLPFDDNLCLNELCEGYKLCLSDLKYVIADPFITSDMMLFRPIHPRYTFRCSCPKGFAGKKAIYTCDTEVDMCYSNPCQNRGTCVKKEGGHTCLCKDGYAGENCQYDNSTAFDSLTCPSDLCQPPSKCEPLSTKGFYCKGCSNAPEYNKFCQLTTRRFTKGSFLTFPALKKRHRFTIQMKFATQMKNGLLFYNGRFNERHDFISLEIIDRQLLFSFSLGANITSVMSNVEGGVSNGEWHTVTVQYHNRTVTLSVGEECDTEISVRFGELISDNQCARRVTHTLPDSCFETYEKPCYKLLDLTGPFQIGGLPKLPSEFQIQNKDFDGCIKDVYVDQELLDLNKFVANVGTQLGCREKKSACLSAPCANGGTCIDVWDTFLCKCPMRTGAKDCSQVIDEPIRVDGAGYQTYSDTSLPSKTILFPWYTGISVRTRATEGVLMYITVTGDQYVLMELHEGYVQYNYSGSGRVYTFDYLPVNDGQWHYLEVRWRKGQIILVVDYGVWQSLETMSSSIENKQIQKVHVGAQKSESGAVEKGLVGCLQNVRVGNNQASILQRPAESVNVNAGCQVEGVCQSNTCPTGATCVDEWKKAKCVCPKGTLGPECKAICQTYNPCQNHAICHGPTYKPELNADYTCECGTLLNGRYCEEKVEESCVKGWYGYPICGPCNCSRELGYDTECQKTDGMCICQKYHYRPKGSDRCRPCDCYKYGTVDQSLTCDQQTGQCQCKGNIVGRRCDQCSSKYAHISFSNNDAGCIVTTNMCPRNFYQDVWWEATYYDKLVVQDCPTGAVGDAKRNCSRTSIWSEPNLFNCTNKDFIDLKTKVEEIESRTLKINSFVAKTTMEGLAMATAATDILFGSDINITYRLMIKILEYENNQTGLSLTSEQDSTFIQHMLNALSIVLDVKYKSEWTIINSVSGGTQELLYQLEQYLITLTKNMERLQKTPYSVISKSMVLSLDTISPQNYSGVKIPKFDNIVHRPTFDDNTYVLLPKSLLESSMADYIQQVMNTRSNPPKAYVSYMMHNTIGHLLPRAYDDTVRVIADRPVVTNSPVFTLVVLDKDKVKKGGLSDPIQFHYKQQVLSNRTDPQCAYWKPDGMSGSWSTSGCKMDRWYEVIIKQPISRPDTEVVKEKYVVCSCSHMTSFSLLMDVADTEYVARAAISLAIFSYVGICISLGCLLVTFIIFISFKHLQCNANSIMLNLIFTIFMSELAFVIGVDRVGLKLICRVVAIGLHFFYLSAFTWLFVEMLHLYRRLIEIREINYGAMKFYYLLGYVIPGIIVGLSVGLYTDGYGNSSFCWMDMTDPFIWSFAGPVAIAIPAIIFLFILGLHASSKEKTHVNDITTFRTRIFCGIILLLLLGVSWILSLLAVNYDLQALYYVYTAFAFAQGVFIFLAYVLGDPRVRFHLKKQWYKMQGKKLENPDGVSSRPVSRSALAYRRDSIDGYINRTNVGISTTSTTSRSTSKSSGGLFKGEDYLRSTDTSTSGHVPSYNYDNTYHEKSSELPVPGERRRKRRNRNDSDTESDVSVGDASLELASSHSSDEDDEFDIGPSWEKELPKNKKIEEAKEQARRKKREEKMKDVEHEQNLQNLQHMQSVDQPPNYHHVIPTPSYGHWPGDPNLSGFQHSDSDFHPSDLHPSDQQTMSSVPPDVTIPAQELKGKRDYIIPPIRSDSLMNDSSSISNHTGPFNVPVPETRMKVQVLTHNGSISSDTECSDETTV